MEVNSELVDGVCPGAVVLDAELRVLECTEEAAYMLGCSEDDLLGRSLLQTLVEADSARLLFLLHPMLHGDDAGWHGELKGVVVQHLVSYRSFELCWSFSVRQVAHLQKAVLVGVCRVFSKDLVDRDARLNSGGEFCLVAGRRIVLESCKKLEGWIVLVEDSHLENEWRLLLERIRSCVELFCVRAEARLLDIEDGTRLLATRLCREISGTCEASEKINLELRAASTARCELSEKSRCWDGITRIRNRGDKACAYVGKAQRSNWTDEKFEALLQSRKGIQEFTKFLMTLHTEEGILFYKEAVQFRSIKDVAWRRHAADRIYHHYVEPGSPMEINVSSRIRGRVGQVLMRSYVPIVPREVFEECVQDTLKYLRFGPFESFVRKYSSETFWDMLL